MKKLKLSVAIVIGAFISSNTLLDYLFGPIPEVSAKMERVAEAAMNALKYGVSP